MSRTPEHRPLAHHRVKAAMNEIQRRVDAINADDRAADKASYLGASLRGKRIGYLEANEVLRALLDEVRLPHRWWNRKSEIRGL